MKTTKYTPETLQRWTLPSDYGGATWYDYYGSGVGRNRDSGPLDNANFDSMLEALQEIPTPEDWPHDCACFQTVCENHWAVGWVEWIAIHDDATAHLMEADRIAGALEDYPVIDDTKLSELESEAFQESWDFWGRKDYTSELSEKLCADFPDGISEVWSDDELTEALDDLTAEEIDGLRAEASRKVNWEYQSEDSGVSINIEGLVEHTDTDKLADLLIECCEATQRAKDITKLAKTIGATEEQAKLAIAKGYNLVSQIKTLLV
jgi:hypothetical protein